MYKLSKILLFVFLSLWQINAMENDQENPEISPEIFGQLKSLCQEWKDITENEIENFQDIELPEEARKMLDEGLAGKIEDINSFIQSIETSSITDLLDEFLIFRENLILARKELFDRRHTLKEGKGFIPFVPLSEKEKEHYKINAGNITMYHWEIIQVESFIINKLIRTLFLAIPDPSKLHQSIKLKIQTQPSLWEYIQNQGRNPWGLDLTLGTTQDILHGKDPYFEIPDLALINDYVITKPHVIRLCGWIAKDANETLQTTIVNQLFLPAGQIPENQHRLNKEYIITECTDFEAGVKCRYPLPYPYFLKPKEIIPLIIQQSITPVIDTQPNLILLDEKNAEKITTLNPQQLIIQNIIHQKKEEKPLPISLIIKKKKEDIQALPSKGKESLKKTTTIFTKKVEEWLENELFNYQITQISGHDWESMLNKINGVDIRLDGGSHAEVLKDGRVVGGFFRSKTYYTGYKQRLQNIIINLGYEPKQK